MTALELQIQKDMALLRDDEGMMKRLAKYVKRLLAQKNGEADDSKLTKEEFLAQIKRGEEQVKRGQTRRFGSVDELDKYISSL